MARIAVILFAIGSIAYAVTGGYNQGIAMLGISALWGIAAAIEARK